MQNAAALPIYIYFGLILVSRLFFKHRELVRAAGPGVTDQPGPQKRRGALFCLLPLGLMQIVPCVGYWLTYFPVRETPVARRFFGLLLPGNAAAGLILFVVGTLLAARASRQLARCWRESPGELCVSGLYSIVRHPLYAAYLLQGAGCMLMLGAIWSWIAWGAAAVLIVIRTVQEDRELAAHYPAFEEYSRRAKRLIPGIF
jgi:protein-S-isoprenylcysteine O-methyltransferase Ste14